MRGYIITLYEIKPEPAYVTYMSVYPFIHPFQKYLGISVVFGLMICTAPANTTVGNEHVLVGFREDDNMFLFPCMKISLSAACFLKAGPISSAGRVEFI